MEEKFLQVDGNRIRYLESGASGDTLVLLHGLGASAERWLDVTPFFEDHFHLVIPDLIGFGYSDKPTTDYTSNLFLQFLKDFLRVARISNPYIIGSSLGGQIAALYASSHSEDIKKLVLVSPAGTMTKSTKSLDAYIMAAMYPNSQNAQNAFELMEGSREKIPDATISEFVTRMRLPNAKLAFMSTVLGMKSSESIISKLPSITVPTMIIWGADDPVIPIHYADGFVSAIPGVVFSKMSRCGHTPYVASPKIFARKVLKFFSKPDA